MARSSRTVASSSRRRRPASDPLLQELEGVAGAMGVRVTYEAVRAGTVQGGGGLCRIHGRWRVIIDKRLDVKERARVLAEALGRFELPERELSKPARALLSNYAVAQPVLAVAPVAGETLAGEPGAGAALATPALA